MNILRAIAGNLSRVVPERGRDHAGSQNFSTELDLLHTSKERAGECPKYCRQSPGGTWSSLKSTADLQQQFQRAYLMASCPCLAPSHPQTLPPKFPESPKVALTSLYHPDVTFRSPGVFEHGAGNPVLKKVIRPRRG